METVSRIHQNRGFFSAFTLLALYGLLIFLVISFSGQILEDFSSAGGSEERNFILLTTLLLSVVILVIMVLQFIRLVKDQREGKPGARIKGRFVRYFILIGVLSSLPQGILATHFIDRVFNSILGANLGQSLEGGINIALNFYRERKDDLRALGNSTILQDLLEEDIPRNPENLAQKLVEISPALSFLQVFSPQGEMILSQGNDLGQVRYSNIENYPAGPLLPITRGDITVERYFSRVPGTRGEYSVVLGTNLPQGFEDQTELIQMARRVYVQMLTFQERFRFSLIFFYLIFALPILLLSIFLSFLLTDRLLRPLVNLESATRSVAEGDFTTRILAPPKDVLSNLVNSFNSMVEELQNSRSKILQTEKISAWQEIAQRLAHEIRNPLTPIKLSAERILRRSKSNPEGLEHVIEKAVGAITSEVNKLDNMLKEFRDFARLPLPQKRWFDLSEVLKKIVSMHSTAHPGITFTLIGASDPWEIYGDENQLDQVFTNLVKNSAEAMEFQGEIQIRIVAIRKGHTPYLRIQIQDDGPGIPEELRDRVFNPYYTTKKEGTGLGLPIVERIIFDHNGVIWFESQESVGTTFFIDLKQEGKDG
jgi:two-component system nitrogen regulation sensor histidine kinase NtrY